MFYDTKYAPRQTDVMTSLYSNSCTFREKKGIS